MSLIDFHCHLDLYQNFPNLLEKCEREKIYTLAVTTTPKAWPRNHELTKNKHFVKAALGFHPQLVSETWKEELNTWGKYLPEAKYIGEVGIDGSNNYAKTLQFQKQVFEAILRSCAEVGDKVLSVHSLNGSKIVLDLLEDHLLPNKGKVVLHWFTGTIPEAKRALELGCHFSINPKMLQTKKGIKLIEVIPVERMLTETDGPFVQQNILDAISGLARVKNKPSDYIKTQIEKNFKFITKIM